MIRFLQIVFCAVVAYLLLPLLLQELARGHYLNAGFAALFGLILLSAANPDANA